MKKINILLTLLVFVVCALILALSIRGLAGNPTPAMLLQTTWRDNGPFELSPERGRYALTYSLVETHSVFFPVDIARFVLPDLGYNSGHYVSLFAPALSFIVAPGYILGRMIGLEQIGTFAVISLFALLNVFLIYKIAIKIGANAYAALLSGMVFLFATPAYTYAVDLYQHHLTTFIILLSIYLLMQYKNFWMSFCIFFLYAFGVALDYPNMFMMFPILIFLLLRFISTQTQNKKIQININFLGAAGFVGVVIPLIFFFWFNTISYGGPLHTLGSSAVTSVKAIDDRGIPVVPPHVNTVQSLQNNNSSENSSLFSFFQTRNLINGLYIHIFSPDRGIIYFTPVILVGLIGIVLAYKRRKPFLALLLSIIGVNILLYSLWGDPWGGWAFGSRYLIPSYALLAIFIACALTYFKKNIIFIILFSLLLFYSVSVNTLGAITSSSIPPQVQVIALGSITHVQEKYSYDRDVDTLMSNSNKSFVWQTYLQKYISAVRYYWTIVGLIFSVFMTLLIFLRLQKGKELE